MSRDTPPYQEALDGFKKHFLEKGVLLKLDLRDMEKQGESDTTLQDANAAAFDLVLALGSAATRKAARETRLPIVSGLALRESDLRAAPNMTGVYLEFPVETELSWMRKFLPRMKRVGVLFSMAENAERISEAGRAATSMSLELKSVRIDNPSQIPEALASLSNEADALWGVADDVVLTPETAQAFLLFSMRNRIPFVGLSIPWVKAGALYALDRDYADIGRQCGEMATRILLGEAPGAVAPASPRAVIYSVNLRTASQMKLNLSQDLVRGARDVVE